MGFIPLPHLVVTFWLLVGKMTQGISLLMFIGTIPTLTHGISFNYSDEEKRSQCLVATFTLKN